MSGEAMQAVWERSLTKGVRRLVMLTLADNAGPDNITSVAFETIARRCRCKATSVPKLLADLRHAGEVDILSIGHIRAIVKLLLVEEKA